MDKEVSKAEAILEEMDEQIRIFQSARKIISYETLKTKYSDSWKKLTERINRLIFQYLTDDMVRTIPQREGEVEKYLSFLSSLYAKYDKQCSRIANYMPSPERKRALSKIREEMLKAEKEYCENVKKHGNGQIEPEDGDGAAKEKMVG